jgi:hypothetical protein
MSSASFCASAIAKAASSADGTGLAWGCAVAGGGVAGLVGCCEGACGRRPFGKISLAGGDR